MTYDQHRNAGRRIAWLQRRETVTAAAGETIAAFLLGRRIAPMRHVPSSPDREMRYLRLKCRTRGFR